MCVLQIHYFLQLEPLCMGNKADYAELKLE